MQRRQVLARDLPVFREQGLPNVSYFEDDEPVPLGAKLMDLSRSGPLPAHVHVELPRWCDCVRNLLDSLGVMDHDSWRTSSAQVAE
jgi:hypothetical protein